MKRGTIYRPYATQLLPFGKLKFWFALHDAEKGKLLRYELSFSRGSNTPSTRYRAFNPSGSPKYGSNFYEFLVPEDIRNHDSLPYPRFKGDTLSKAAKSMLSQQQIADLTSFRIVGTISPQPQRQTTLPLMALNGETDAP